MMLMIYQVFYICLLIQATHGLNKETTLLQSGRITSYQTYSPHPQERFLRGGRSGSSSYHSNTGRYNHNKSGRYNTHSSGKGMSTAGKFMAGAAIGLIGLALFAALVPGLGGAAVVGACCALPACLAGLCCGAGAVAAAATQAGGRNKPTSEAFAPGLDYQQQDDDAFEERVERAMMSVTPSSSPPMAIPFTGEYTTKYEDLGETKIASLKLEFVDNGSGFRISGGGSDVDGTTVIEDGYANYDGVAWWRERNVTGDIGLQVLSTGHFNFMQRTFDGYWYANTGEGGPYKEFRVNNGNQGQTFTPMQMEPNNVNSNYVVQGTSIPTATAVPYIPPSMAASQPPIIS